MTHRLMTDESNYREVMTAFPVGMPVTYGNQTLWVMGYAPPDNLICACINPCDNYNAAIQSCWSYCASIFRVKH